jgi:hypothetical protein
MPKPAQREFDRFGRAIEEETLGGLSGELPSPGKRRRR